jgi:hypothetical protein
MSEERRLSKMEASLGLTLIAGLLAALGFAYVHQLDTPPPATLPDPNWVSAQATPPAKTAVERTAYRPEWLPSQTDEPKPAFIR